MHYSKEKTFHLYFALMRIVFLLLAVILPHLSFSQYDTAYVMRFPERLGIALYQSKPSYEIRIWNKQPVQGAVNELDFKTQAKYITGIGLHYDKLSFFAGIKTAGEKDKRKGNTKSSQFNLAFTGVTLRVEASVRFYKGFYENNSGLYIPSFADSSEYYQNDEMKASSWKLKMFYFFNTKKRFTYGAAYINNTRQIKSAGSLRLTANLYQFGVKNDGQIIPYYLDSIFAPYNKIDKYIVTGFSTGIGYTHTFVIFKRLFLNLLGSLGIERQSLNLFVNDESFYKNSRTIFSAYDFRSSFGYNSNRFYFSFHSIIDGNIYSFDKIDVTNNFINSIFLIGYRFGVKIPVIDRFENKK